MGLKIKTSLTDLSEVSAEEQLIYQNALTAYNSKAFKADNLISRSLTLDITTGAALAFSVFAGLGITDTTKVTSVFIAAVQIPQSVSESADPCLFTLVATIAAADRAMGSVSQFQLVNTVTPPTEIKISNVIVPASPAKVKLFILVSTKN